MCIRDRMKLVRFSYENGELADHEICAIDFSEMENLREGTIALCMAGEDKYRVTVSPDKRAEDGAGGKQVYTDIELPSYIGETVSYTHLDVYKRQDMDNVIGVLNQKDFHNYIKGGRASVSEYIKPVIFVAGSMKIAQLLKRLQTAKTHIAVIVDEYGGTYGLATLEDIIEELVGEI